MTRSVGGAGGRLPADAAPLVLLNPLPLALAHYETALIDCLDSVGIRWERAHHPGIERGGEGRSRLRRSAAALVAMHRAARRARSSGARLLVLWPAFGLLDLLVWRWAGSRGCMVVVHDPVPLRRTHGYGWLATRLTRRAGKTIDVLVHTQLAREALRELGIRARCVLHPVLTAVDRPAARGEVVRVLGQFKPSRDVVALAEIAAPGAWQCEIVGRGWPPLSGWDIVDEFIPEAEFDRLLRSSAAIVIPYRHFYQSGVAVRALEVGTPIVAPRHEHVTETWGPDWPGIVADGDWVAAVRAAISASSDDIARRYERARVRAVESWRAILASAEAAS